MPSVPYYPNAKSRYVKFRLTLSAADPLLFLAPSLDADLTVHIHQFCHPLLGMNSGLYKVDGSHDGYPGHKLYLDGVLILGHLPSVTGDGPSSLTPLWGNYSVSTDWIPLPTQ